MPPAPIGFSILYVPMVCPRKLTLKPTDWTSARFLAATPIAEFSRKLFELVEALSRDKTSFLKSSSAPHFSDKNFSRADSGKSNTASKSSSICFQRELSTRFYNYFNAKTKSRRSRKELF